MLRIDLPRGKPSLAELSGLEQRCRCAIARLRSPECETRLPLFIEFAGSPKSGKSTIIGIVSHFLRRMGTRVAKPPEGASLRTPEPLKEDWLAFNAWSGCYALQNILVDAFVDPPVDIVLLDRGLFDIAAWAEFLFTSEQRITDDDRRRMTEFFSLDLWRSRINAVFLFTADHQTSMERENDCKLTQLAGSMMNSKRLQALERAYLAVAEDEAAGFSRVFGVDTSRSADGGPDFQRIACKVAEEIVHVIEDLSNQELLVTNQPRIDGFQTKSELVQQLCAQIVRDGRPLFVERSSAESSPSFVQVVPYAIIRNHEGRYMMARRRADQQREELRAKRTLLAGGHAERRDWDPERPLAVFERCLRRELDEEFVGMRVESIRPIGFVYDPHTAVGMHHLAFIHEAVIGGRMAIRRQAVDNEFGREGVDWVAAEEIREHAGEFDPWSQIVAQELFDAPAPNADPSLRNPAE